MYAINIISHFNFLSEQTFYVYQYRQHQVSLIKCNMFDKIFVYLENCSIEKKSRLEKCLKVNL